jgi:nucleotide-binding universal stress UspA family protein
MLPKTVKHIICAVRGHPESRATVTRAINLALEYRSRLTFLHVIDAEFLEYATVGPLSVIYKELVEMARFTMLILCDRAERRGVSEVNHIVLEGNTRKQLRQFAIDTVADLMIMGSPLPSLGKSVFNQDELQQFMGELEQEGNIHVLLVEHPGGAGV